MKELKKNSKVDASNEVSNDNNSPGVICYVLLYAFIGIAQSQAIRFVKGNTRSLMSGVGKNTRESQELKKVLALLGMPI